MPPVLRYQYMREIYLACYLCSMIALTSCRSIEAPAFCRESVKSICEGYQCRQTENQETLLEAMGFTTVSECRASLEASCDDTMCEVSEQAAADCLNTIDRMSCDELASGDFPYECIVWCE